MGRGGGEGVETNLLLKIPTATLGRKVLSKNQHLISLPGYTVTGVQNDQKGTCRPEHRLFTSHEKPLRSYRSKGEEQMR